MGGVRVGENMAVTKDGVEVLTAYPREFALSGLTLTR